MTGAPGGSDVHILPYSHVVGQAELKLALELNYIAPRIGGVLISGQRGTAKSTVVRAFSLLTGANCRSPSRSTRPTTGCWAAGSWTR